MFPASGNSFYDISSIFIVTDAWFLSDGDVFTSDYDIGTNTPVFDATGYGYFSVTGLRFRANVGNLVDGHIYVYGRR